MASPFITRDISWLSFNARILQEANDTSVPLKERIRFLGIFSNNLDEFFRVRVATLKRMIELTGKRKKLNFHLEEDPGKILDQIQVIVLKQQNEFHRIWKFILEEMARQQVFLLNENELNKEQKQFVTHFFENEVRSFIIPLMIESLPELPYLRDKSIYLGIVMQNIKKAYNQKFSLIEVPSKSVGRFLQLPSNDGKKYIILLEDVIRFNLPEIFSYFKFDHFEAHVFKVTKDAEIDMEEDQTKSFIEKLSKGIKDRRRGKPVRFVYDKEMNPGLLEYLIKRLKLNRKSNIIPGGRIHNFRHFMDFPDIITDTSNRKKPFGHPSLENGNRITDVILKKDILLHFPYHSFDPIIDLLREAAMDPDVKAIKITAYRLASNSKIINALVNASRNGKVVEVMLELKARFDEEANLEWKSVLEEEGVKVVLGVPNMKIHAKVCIIKKRVGTKTIQYGFVSTGNLNEKTARIYADHCLLTSDRAIMADINKVFAYLEHWQKGTEPLKNCNTLLVAPVNMRSRLLQMIERETRHAKKKKPASITIKSNSLSDKKLIEHLELAAIAGVEINLIIRGIVCMKTQSKKYKKTIKAVSIVDEYLEHARVMIFHNEGKESTFISSADWMVRNLDHRVEVGVEIKDPALKEELKSIVNIQLQDNVKARVLDNELLNNYVPLSEHSFRSQIATYEYLIEKKISEVSSHRHRK